MYTQNTPPPPPFSVKPLMVHYFLSGLKSLKLSIGRPFMFKSEFNNVSHTLPPCILLYSNIYIILHNVTSILILSLTALNEEVRGRWVHPHFLSEEIKGYTSKMSCSWFKSYLVEQSQLKPKLLLFYPAN